MATEASELYIQRAEFLLQKQRFELALEQLSHALSEDPNNTLALLFMGTALLGLKKYDQAIEVVENAIALEPDDADGYRLLGFIYLDQKKLNEAKKLFETSLEYDPQFLATWSGLATCALFQKDIQGAAEYARRGLEIEPDDQRCLYILSWTQTCNGDLEAASISAHELISRHVNSAASHFSMGIYEASQGQIDVAIERFTEALRLSPNDPHLPSVILTSIKLRTTFFKSLFGLCCELRQLFGHPGVAVFLFSFSLFWLTILVGTGRQFTFDLAITLGPLILLMIFWAIQFENVLFLTLIRFSKAYRHYLRPREIQSTTIFIFFVLTGLIAITLGCVFGPVRVPFVLFCFFVILAFPFSEVPLAIFLRDKIWILSWSILTATIGLFVVIFTITTNSSVAFVWYIALSMLSNLIVISTIWKRGFRMRLATPQRT